MKGENENLRKEGETLCQTLEVTGGKLFKSKEAVDAKNIEMKENLEALKGAKVRFEELRSEEERTYFKLLLLFFDLLPLLTYS